MRILYLANNRVGMEVAQLLERMGDEVVGVGVHTDGRAVYRHEILETFNLPADRVIVGKAINDPAVHERIRTWQVDVILSVLFDHILTGETLKLAKRGGVNLHNSYLPYNRGNFANVWSIVTQTPAGATLHLMDEGIDTGAIIDRMEVPVDLKDTGETLYRKIETACVRLFRKAWPKFKSGEFTPIEHRQESPTPTYRKCDVDRIDRIDPNQTYKAGELIDILRARTFPPYAGAYLDVNGRKIFLRLELLDESEL